MEWTTLAVAGMSLIGTLAGTFGGILVSNKLTTYRIEQLERKVAAHKQPGGADLQAGGADDRGSARHPGPEKREGVEGWKSFKSA